MSYLTGLTAVAALSCCAASVLADDGTRPGSLATLAADPEVLSDLGVHGEQKDRLTQVTKRLAETNVSTADAHEKLGAVLSPGQLTRLKQIRWQHLGGASVFESEVANALRLDDAQKRKLEPVRRSIEDEHSQLLEQLKRIRFRSAAARREFIAKAHNSARSRVNKVLDEILTKDQKKAYESLMGKKAPGLP